MCDYGLHLLHGVGAERRPEEGVEWLLQAEEQEYPYAIFALGWCSEMGEGLPQDWGRRWSGIREPLTWVRPPP